MGIMQKILNRLIQPWLPFGAFGIFVALITLAACGAMLAQDVLSVHGGVAIDEHHVLGRDFVNIWHGGRLATEDGAAAVYDRDHYRQTLAKALGIVDIYAFSYPPQMLLASIPFGQLSYGAALLMWTVVTSGLFWYAARPFLVNAQLPSWSVLALPAFWVNLWAGHFGCLMGALALYGWHYAATKPKLSGAAFALMTVKPHFGIFVPFILAAGRRWGVILWAACLTAIFIAASIIVLGPMAWKDWLMSTIPFQSSLIGAANPNLAYLQMMPTVERLGAAIGLAGFIKSLFQLVFAGAAVLLLVKPWRDGASVADIGLLSTIAVFLVLPYAFNYDMVGYCLAILVLAARYQHRFGTAERWLLGWAFVIPAVHPFLASLSWQPTPLIILGTLAVLSRSVSADARLSG
jgi:alpha-1,2-mannosyltransferase